ncbi:MAG: hypothetical protein ABI678_08065 [Kofleriaceae bacterium]
MSRSLTILLVLLSFGTFTVASAGGNNVDWSQFVEKPGDKPFRAAPAENRVEVPKAEPTAKAPAKGRKAAKATKAKPAAKAKSKAARGRRH